MTKMSKTQRKRLVIYNKQKGLCVYCDVKMWSRGAHKKGHVDTMATFEHIHPKGMGGGKAYDNLACSCSKCNRNRGQIDHFVFMKIRKRKNWQNLARIEKWKIEGIYTRKMREMRMKKWRNQYRLTHPFLYKILLKVDKVQRKKNHFVHYYIPLVKKQYKTLYKQNYRNTRGNYHRLCNKTKSLISNTFKQFEIQSFKPLSR